MIQKKWFPVCLAFLFVASFGHAEEKLTLSIDNKILEAGKIQTFTYEYTKDDTGAKKRGVGVILIDASPEVVWEYLLKWDEMGEYVPSLEYYKTILPMKTTAMDGQRQSLFEGKLKFPLLTVTYTLDVLFNDKEFRQDWRLITPQEQETYANQGVNVTRASTGIKNIEGFCYLEPYADGAKTVYYYAPIVETSGPIPGFVERFISKSTLPGFMEGVKKRVESKGAYKK